MGHREAIDALLATATDEVREEAKGILLDLGLWAQGELPKALTGTIDDVLLPATPGGGQLADMTLDEALAGSAALSSATREALEAKQRNREQAGRIVESIFAAALRIIISGAAAL